MCFLFILSEYFCKFDENTNWKIGKNVVHAEITPDDYQDTVDDSELNWRKIEKACFYFENPETQSIFVDKLSLTLCMKHYFNF